MYLKNVFNNLRKHFFVSIKCSMKCNNINNTELHFKNEMGRKHILHAFQLHINIIKKMQKSLHGYMITNTRIYYLKKQ